MRLFLLTTGLAAALGCFCFSPLVASEARPGREAPLEAVDAKLTIKLRLGEQRILQVSGRVKRLMTSNRDVCAAVAYDGGHIGLIGRGKGQSDLAVWLDSASGTPIVCVVEVE